MLKYLENIWLRRALELLLLIIFALAIPTVTPEYRLVSSIIGAVGVLILDRLIVRSLPRKLRSYGMLKGKGISSDEFIRLKHEETEREERRWRERTGSSLGDFLDDPESEESQRFKKRLLDALAEDSDGRDMLIEAELAGPEGCAKHSTVVCSMCEMLAVWERRTQFAGNHPYCQTHAEKQEDFGLEDDSYFYWKKIA